MIGNARFHRRRDAKAGMHAAEIVVGEVQRDSGFQVRQFLAEGVCQPRESANRHPHGEVLPLHKADVRDVRRDRDRQCGPWI